MAKLPNFLIIGAAKSGTTALFEYLEQHPEVYLCNPKEPHFFAFEGERPAFSGPGDAQMINRVAVTNLPQFNAMFAKAGQAKAIGEASVSTLYYPRSIERIKKHTPDAKIICMLRQPAERAYSAFSYMQMRTYEPCDSFATALAQEDQRIAENWHHIWHYRRMGLYYDQLQHYVNAFGRDRVKIYLFDDFRRDSKAVLRDCFEFLEIEPNFKPPLEPSPLVSGKPKRAWLQSIVMREGIVKRMLKAVLPKRMKQQLQSGLKKINLERVPIDPQIREELTNSMRDDILRLQDLIQHDLTRWLQPREKRSSSPTPQTASV